MQKTIYFIQEKGTNAIKIGITTNVLSRLHSLGTSNPYELELLATTNGTEEDEKNLHEKFSKYRLKGEWFKENDELLKLIKETRNLMDENQYILYLISSYEMMNTNVKISLMNWIKSQFKITKGVLMPYVNSEGIKELFQKDKNNEISISDDQLKGTIIRFGSKILFPKSEKWLFEAFPINISQF